MDTSDYLLKEEYYKNFALNPCGKTAFDLVIASKEEIKKIAFGWNHDGLSLSDKIKELICEMFLALLEDFDANIKAGYGSVISFIRKRLLRITKPRTRSFVDVDSDDFDDPPDTGRICLTSEKLEQTEIMFESIRKASLSVRDEETALLFFLFIHIYPDVMWASHYLTSKYGGDKLLRVANDRKRIYRFNGKLRDILKQNKNFDYDDILTWNSGERNYLACRLIGISPHELFDNEALNELSVVDEWHAEFIGKKDYSEENFISARKVFFSMQKKWQKLHKNDFLEEEKDYFGRVPDILGILLGKPDKAKFNIFNEPAMPEYTRNSISDKEFNAIAEELSEWFNNLYNSRKLKVER